MCDMEFVYRCSWFKTKRTLKSDTTMFYKEAKHTEWVFDTDDYKNGLVRVEYLPVCKMSSACESAIHNSKVKNAFPNKENINPLIKDDFILALNGC